jgi:tetratricopeptide (TPR) repeat protein
MIFVACQSAGNKDTIARLRHVQIDIKEEKIDGGLDRAMAGYQRFLEETPESALTPEAIRRLADLKIEKEYGTLTEDNEPSSEEKESGTPAFQSAKMTPPSIDKKKTPIKNSKPSGASTGSRHDKNGSTERESEADFEKRATQQQQIPEDKNADGPIEGVNDLERASAREAIALYNKLLKDYPLYERNDQVLYQMSRAYEELGETEEAMTVMERIVREYPQSRYIDEVQFRRAEHFFAYKHYLDAEDAYSSIVDMGVGSAFYELALYKLGWTFYKQELYEDGLHKFIALLDYKVSIGYDFEQTEDETKHKRTKDTFRVISLSFSNLGGSDSVVEYFSDNGHRIYEDSIYSNLAEFYFDKRRYADASATYNAFVSRNPFHKVAPNFHMRVIDIHAAGGFPSLVLDAKKSFATTYGLKAEYWTYFEPSERPDVLGHLKTNLTDLANHYHASYQNPKLIKEKPGNFKEALHWYREFLVSFPADEDSPAINYQLADLLLENKSFGEAAAEYEKTAYGYPSHDKSSEAGYAAVYAYREQMGAAESDGQERIKREVVRSSLLFADTFPKHEKAALVLGAAADDLFSMEEYEQALVAAKKLLDVFPEADLNIVRSAWLVIGHSSYELEQYSEAEIAYLKVLDMLPEGDKTRDALVDNLAASVYKQGEQAKAAEEHRIAADHFLRVGRIAPNSSIWPTAEYDAAAALIQLEDWDMAASVLTGFRNTFPGHELQPEVTKKIAFVYRENGQLSMAANEYERIETESEDEEIRREALLVAADLYEKDGDKANTLVVYQRYVEYFPRPVELNLETRNKIAQILKEQNDRNAYLSELEKIVAIDGAAGPDRTPRTIYLAGTAALVLAETRYEKFLAVKLVKPFEVNLRKKRQLMKSVTKEFTALIDYEIGEVTAASTFYLAEIYAHFSVALMTSERPEGLSPMELEEYELAIEEQAYPFEEKAIAVHENNIELIYRGVYNEWIEKSLQKLAEFVPARYAKPEEASDIISSLDTFLFAINRPVESLPAEVLPDVEEADSIAPEQVEESGEPIEIEPQMPSEIEESETAAAL